ncbi:hypothetical protein [Shinella kummerowiae]|uniref:hypothetical protein n=1 Tax=Shinella kummerowiae TaxID=417745 RepID=UPI0021B6C44D|nr:hypothetical protein [Shinella kummerowiae]MCT7665661.1 hypothetical protein [Shinella kummerowiae]
MVNPVFLPALPFADCEFDPVQPWDTNRMEGRRTESVGSMTPYWKAKYRFDFLRREQLGKVDAFVMQAGGDGETFLAYDVSRPRPIAHDTGEPLFLPKAGGGVFNGEATLQEIVDSRTLVVSGLPANFQLSAGDYLEVRQSILVRSLHRIMADATANGSGVVTLSIKYGLDLNVFTTDAIIDFERPSCLMQIDPGSWSASKAMNARTPSFSATEVFPA